MSNKVKQAVKTDKKVEHDTISQLDNPFM